MRLIAAELAAGRQTLLLVPEIGLTPQLVRRLRERFGDELAVLHSAVTERERFDAWRRAYRGEARLVVGTRSAVFAPLPSAGLIIVDEEHDSSYKQQTRLPLLGARSRRRARAAPDVPVVLGSATPSLETFNNAPQGRYAKLEHCRGASAAAGTPQVRVVDLEPAREPASAIDAAVIAAIGQHLARRQPSAAVPEPPRLRAGVVLPELQGDRAMPTLRRAHDRARESGGACAATTAARSARSSWTCAACGSERIAVGAGTQRVGDELAALFPGGARRAPRSRQHEPQGLARRRARTTSRRRNVEILIGTQMLTKGHDFPRVTLVGVLNADQGLFGTDPRSHERLAQTILQVAGRAGRADRPGEVVIQTHYPDHPLLECLLDGDYTAFATLALAERREARLAAVRAPRRVARGSRAPRRRLRVPRARAQRRGGVRARRARGGLGPRAAADGAQGRALSRAAAVSQRASERRCIELVERTLLAVRSSPARASRALEHRHRPARGLTHAGSAAIPRLELAPSQNSAHADGTPQSQFAPQEKPRPVGCGCCSASRSASSSRSACILRAPRRHPCTPSTAVAVAQPAAAGPRRGRRARAAGAAASALRPPRIASISTKSCRSSRSSCPTKTAPAAPAAQRRPAEAPGSFLLQAGSFSAAADADRLQASLALLGFESHVQRVTLDDDVFNRVRIGPIGDLDAANRTQRRLRDAGIDTLLMKVPKLAGAQSSVSDWRKSTPERAQLAVEVRALHADALRELPDLAAAEQQLLLQIRALEMLARLAQRHREQVLLDERLAIGRVGRELRLDFGERNLLRAAEDQQALDHVPQLAHVARPRIVAQPILRRDAEAPKRQPFRVDEQVDVMAQQLGHVLGVLAQRRHADDDDAQVRKELAAAACRCARTPGNALLKIRGIRTAGRRSGPCGR